MSQTPMTSHDRLVAALEGQPLDYLPFSPFLAYVWQSFPEEVQADGQLAFLQSIGADPLWRGAVCAVKAIMPEVEHKRWEEGDRIFEDTITPAGTLHREWLRTDEAGEQTAFLIHHPLHTEADYRTQIWIEENTRMALDLAPVQEHLNTDGSDVLSIGMLIPRGKSAFQSLIEHYAGTEELNYHLMDFPGTVQDLWQTMVAKDLEAVELSLQAPYTYFLTWEDSGTQNYSPRQYDGYIGTEIQQWCDLLAKADKRYIQHACGHVRDLVLRMKHHGAFGIESISPPPTGNISIADARAQVGSDFAIIGGVEPTLFLHKTMDEMVPYVHQVIEEGLGGPFILANSDSCPPGVTVEKYALVAQLAREYPI